MENIESLNHQIAAIQSQLNNLGSRPVSIQPYQALITPKHTVQSVDSYAGAEAVLKDMPAGSSDIVAHSKENIIYILAKNMDSVPLPIKVARVEFIEPEEDPTGYVTKRDLESFKDELRALLAKRGDVE